jgi:hypothetical protein
MHMHLHLLELVDRIMSEADTIHPQPADGVPGWNGDGEKGRLTLSNFLTNAALDRWNCARRLLNRGKLPLK